MHVSFAVLYNQKLLEREQAFTLAKTIGKRMQNHPLLGKEVREISADPSPDLADTSVVLIRVARKRVRVGTTAQDVADYLGEVLDDLLDGDFAKRNARVEVFLGLQQGVWKRS